MEDQNKHIDDLFRDKLGDYTEVPDMSAWSDIEQKLDTKGGDGRSNSSGYNPAGIVLVVVVGVALFFGAKWAIGHFGNKAPQQEITVVNTNHPATVVQDINDLPATTKNEQPVTEAEKISTTAGQSTVKKQNDGPITDNTNGHIKEVLAADHATIPANNTTGKRTSSVLVNKKNRIVVNTAINATAITQGTNTGNIAADATDVNVAEKTAAKHEEIQTNNAVVVQPQTKPSNAAIKQIENLLPKTNQRNDDAQVAVNITKPVTPIKPVQQVMIPNAAITENTEVKLAAEVTKPITSNVEAAVRAIKNDTAIGAEAPIDIPKIIKGKRGKASMEGGLKAGAEAGFSSYAATKILLSPYLLYNMSPSIGILIQPALKYNFLTRSSFGPEQSYHTITSTSIKSGHTIKKGVDSTQPDTIRRRYYYSQSHDSTHTDYIAEKKRFVEIELPILLQYKITKELSVYGGVNFNFSKTIRVKEDRQEFKNIVLNDSVIYDPVSVNAAAPTPPDPSARFNYNTPAYGTSNTTTANTYVNPDTDPVKIGYTLGFTYALKKRWMIDLMMQQMLSDPGYIPNKNVREVYKQPYFRFTVGYRFFKVGK